MKVLLINGSPHRKGCTYTALNEISKSLNEEGIETEIFHIGVDSIRGCFACGQCKSTFCCVFKDGVNVAIEKMETCDGLIVGSPVYYASANGTLVSFLDRMFYASARKMAYKPAAAIVSARRAGTTASFDQLNKYFMINNMPVVSSQYWNMVHGNSPEGRVRSAV